ncbi:MAG: RlmE family RNA methyltransferase [Alphaproteobacteria bacterium]|nr:RlmE family RNA methyltransferase [Alphaproteobacteria bacterium]
MAAGKKGPSGRGAPRQPHVRVKTAKGRKLSSKLWLERQLNDPYVAKAKRLGYRSRAAFKLAEIDDKYKFLKPGGRVVDLGAAPGGWVQVALERVGAKGRVVGIDLQEIEPIARAELLVGDFLDEDAPDRLRTLLDGPADVVLSDMAAPSTGHAATDHLRIMALAEAALDFALEVLAPGGTFVAKVLQGGSERGLLETMRRNFTKVAHVKPPASRKDSAELYVVATGFRGGQDEPESRK